MARARRPLSALHRFAIALLLTLSLVVGAGNGVAAAEPVLPVDAGSGVIYGQVTGSDGDGLAEVRVSVHSWNETLAEWDANSLTFTTSDADGHFTVSSLPAGRYTLDYGLTTGNYLRTWWGHHLSREDADGFDVATDDPPSDRSIELVAGGTVSGRVTGLDGAGIAGAEVEFYRDANGGPTARTDGHGDFERAGLYPGSWVVKVTGPRGSSYLEEWWRVSGDKAQHLVVEAGTTFRDIDVQLATPSTISGRLVDSDGHPMAALSVKAEYQQEGTGTWTWGASDVTDSDGAFTLGRLRGRPYRVSITPGGYGDPKIPSQWWPGTTVEATAAVVDVPAQNALDLGDTTVWRLIRVRYSTLLERTPVVGRLLSAIVLVDSEVTPQRSYTWFRDGVPIDGVTEDGYLVQPGDLGARLTARVELSGPNLVSKTIDLPVSEPVQRGILEPIDGLRLEGTPAGVGVSLSVFGVSWNPAPNEVRFQWRRDNHDISGATASSYTTSSADLGKGISVRVLATRSGYAPVDQVLEAGLACYAESAVQRPTVRGVRAAGSTLTATAGTAPARLVQGFGWQADGVTLAGETKPTLTLTRALVGKAVSPIVTGTLTGCPRMIRGVDGPVVRTALAAKPRIVGTTRLKKTLKINRGSWTSNTQFSYRWYANGKAISKATKATLRLGKSLKGKRISVEVVGKKQGYATVAMRSAGTGKVR